MMRLNFLRCIPLLLLLMAASPVIAQEATQEPLAEGLHIVSAAPEEQQDIYGQNIQVAVGEVLNNTETPYANLLLSAQVFDADGEQIGEGFGYLVDICGAGLLPDYVLPPAHSQRFNIPLELYENDAEIDTIQVTAEGEPIPADAAIEEDSGAITQISDQEVINVIWEGPRSLDYAIGCPRDLESEWSWHRYNRISQRDQAVDYASAELITPELLEILNLTDPLIYQNSRLSFAPGGTRLVYQDRVNRFYTAATDGRFQRQIFGSLNNRSLQTIEWLDDDRFIARYFGAYGDPVLYFTADAEGRALSLAPANNRASVIMPGASRDGRRVIIAGTFDTDAGENILGYYIHVVTNGFFELLFEAEPPGLNYPQPVPIVDVEAGVVSHVFVVRPVDGENMLQCFNRGEGTLTNITPVPLQLADGDRSGMWLSPDGTTMAIAATGANGGLWLVNLLTLPHC